MDISNNKKKAFSVICIGILSCLVVFLFVGLSQQSIFFSRYDFTVYACDPTKEGDCGWWGWNTCDQSCTWSPPTVSCSQWQQPVNGTCNPCTWNYSQWFCRDVCWNWIRTWSEQCDWTDGITPDLQAQNVSCNNCSFSAICGDEIIASAAWETCDDGEDNSRGIWASCTPACREPTCGDGHVNVAGEECDLWNANSNEPNAWCRVDCTLPTCGDGIHDTMMWEFCDAGPTWWPVEINGQTQTCSTECSVSCTDDSVCEWLVWWANAPLAFCGEWQCQFSVCGDGVINGAETCEDPWMDGCFLDPSVSCSENSECAWLIDNSECSAFCELDPSLRCSKNTECRISGVNYWPCIWDNEPPEPNGIYDWDWQNCSDTPDQCWPISGDGCSSRCTAEWFCGDWDVSEQTLYPYDYCEMLQSSWSWDAIFEIQSPEFYCLRQLEDCRDQWQTQCLPRFEVCRAQYWWPSSDWLILWDTFNEYDYCVLAETCDSNADNCLACQLQCQATAICENWKEKIHDLFFVLDRSWSMYAPDYTCNADFSSCTAWPWSAIEIMKWAVNSILQDFPVNGNDQVSIMSFWSDATIDVPLQSSTDQFLLHQNAVSALEPWWRTNLPWWLEFTYNQLSSGITNPVAEPIVIVFADGAPNEESCESPTFGTPPAWLDPNANDFCEQLTLYRANEIKNLWVTIYSFWLNLDANGEALMQAVATAPTDYYFNATDVETDLDDLFIDIRWPECGTCSEPYCGDGITNQTSEQCDDGNSIAWDGCSPRCENETWPYCGDGNEDDWEECDEWVNNGTLASGCTVTCELMQGVFCGDGLENQPFEQCDDGNTDETDGCNNLCRFTRCGDGIVQPNWADNDPVTIPDNETCDEWSNPLDPDGVYNGMPWGSCDTNCQQIICGDWVRQDGEQCDDWTTCANGVLCTGDDFCASFDANVQFGDVVCMRRDNDSCKNDCTFNVCWDWIVAQALDLEWEPSWDNAEICDNWDLNYEFWDSAAVPSANEDWIVCLADDPSTPQDEWCRTYCLYHEDCNQDSLNISTDTHLCSEWQCVPYCKPLQWDFDPEPSLWWSSTVSYIWTGLSPIVSESLVWLNGLTQWWIFQDTSMGVVNFTNPWTYEFFYNVEVQDADDENNLFQCKIQKPLECQISSDCPANSICTGDPWERFCVPICDATTTLITNTRTWENNIDNSDTIEYYSGDTVELACNTLNSIPWMILNATLEEPSTETFWFSVSPASFELNEWWQHELRCVYEVDIDSETVQRECALPFDVFVWVCGDGSLTPNEECEVWLTIDGTTYTSDTCVNCEITQWPVWACGWANGKTYPYNATWYAPDLQCATGTPTDTTFPAQWASVTWTCNASWWNSPVCTASRDVPWCGDDWFDHTSDSDTTTVCNGTNDTTSCWNSASCTATCTCETNPISWVCNSVYDGQSFYTSDTNFISDSTWDRCVSGNAWSVSYNSWTTTWTWTCEWQNGSTTNDVCTATRLFCGDTIEQTNEWENCDDWANGDDTDGCNDQCETVEQQTCSIDGYLYLDIDVNQSYGSWDIPQFPVTVTLDTWASTETDTQGYYLFTGLDCSQDYLISYDTFDTDLVWIPHSAQDEDGSQSTLPIATVTQSTVPSSEFAWDFISVNNNFWLIAYNLSIEKAIDRIEDASGQIYTTTYSGNVAAEDGDNIFYTLSFANEWPTLATWIQVTDTFASGLSNFVIEQQVWPNTLTMTQSWSQLIFMVGDMLPGESYELTLSAQVNGQHLDIIENAATIYTQQGINDPYETTFDDNEDEVEHVILACAVDGVVYVDIADNDLLDPIDLKLDAIPVRVQQTNPNGDVDTTSMTSWWWMYMVAWLSCRHPVQISYTETTNYVPDSAQLHQTQQQSTLQTITVAATDLDGDDSQAPSYQGYFVSEDNNFGLIGYGLDITKSFVSNSYSGMMYDKTTTLSWTTYQVVESGDTVIYELNFANMWPTTVTWVRVQDIMPDALTYIASEVDAAASTSTAVTIIHMASGNILDIYVPIMEAGDAYRILVTTIVDGQDGDIVRNTASVYTNLWPTDPIENEFDPDAVDDNEDDEEILIHHCITDGTVYLDILDDDLYNSWTDTWLSWQQIQFVSDHETYTVTTDENGYYTFVEHSCRYPVEIQFENTTIYKEDSAQFEYDTNNDTTTPEDISIPVATYAQDDKSSLENNFGLVLYDLAIEKWIIDPSWERVKDAWAVRNTIRTYEIDITNNGPTIARDAVVTDWYDAWLEVVPGSLDLWWLAWIVSVTWTGNMLIIENMPDLEAGDSYTLRYEVDIVAESGEVENRVKIYVWDDQTDPIEILHPNGFTNNEDVVRFTLISSWPNIWWWTPPDDDIDIFFEPEKFPELTPLPSDPEVEKIKKEIKTKQIQRVLRKRPQTKVIPIEYEPPEILAPTGAQL